MFNKKTILSIALASIGLLAASGAAQAALVDRGGGLIYDTDLNITWMANANVNGAMTWDNAMTWASNLSYYDSVRNVTYTDWRLPTSDTCSGYNCTGSEMGHLFYTELGGTAGFPISSSTDLDLALFMNIQSGNWYWSGSEDAPFAGGAWVFNFGFGNQDAFYKYGSYFAWAVRPGDVAAVPVPAAVWLFGSGLLGLVGVAQRRAGRDA